MGIPPRRCRCTWRTGTTWCRGCSPDAGRLTAGIFEGIHLAVQNRAAPLHSSVVSATDDLYSGRAQSRSDASARRVWLRQSPPSETCPCQGPRCTVHEVRRVHEEHGCTGCTVLCTGTTHEHQAPCLPDDFEDPSSVSRPRSFTPPSGESGTRSQSCRVFFGSRSVGLRDRRFEPRRGIDDVAESHELSPLGRSDVASQRASAVDRNSHPQRTLGMLGIRLDSSRCIARAAATAFVA